ncbi:uncharacterized protein [Procambarus clarkii]|uniref:uncharacterized protein n=1 Tax=Procambarus clarkii TaxID=6728 RepID=UPI003742FA32
MGSPLRVLFANIYMGTIEQRVLVDMGWKPAMYCRYVDDIFTQVPDVRDMQQLKEAFEQISVLSFTYERENNGKLPFLDVTVMERSGSFHIAVYTKERNIGMCLNVNSDCPDRSIEVTRCRKEQAKSLLKEITVTALPRSLLLWVKLLH